ncbi:MAG: serine/threonine-protein kinase, partial [Planctomycetota bacterium]
MTEVSARDELLQSLLSELSESVRRGEEPDVDALAGEHPDVADELRELYGALRFVEEVAGFPDPLGSHETIDAVRSNAAPDSSLSSSLPRDFGDYELVEELGRGGMGVVFRAKQKSLDRTVALKMILWGENASESDVARFRAEAESAARLDHPNIVKVFEVGEVEGQPFFTMQYIEGTTLADQLKAGALSGQRAAQIIEPLATAIDYAHDCGVLHRDIKPANILIDTEGRPFLTDFGLAKRLGGVESLTRTGAILGTPSYMSPEQA